MKHSLGILCVQQCDQHTQSLALTLSRWPARPVSNMLFCTFRRQEPHRTTQRGRETQLSNTVREQVLDASTGAAPPQRVPLLHFNPNHHSSSTPLALDPGPHSTVRMAGSEMARKKCTDGQDQHPRCCRRCHEETRHWASTVCFPLVLGTFLFFWLEHQTKWLVCTRCHVL